MQGSLCCWPDVLSPSTFARPLPLVCASLPAESIEGDNFTPVIVSRPHRFPSRKRGLAGEQSVRGNSPDGWLRDFPNFFPAVDDDPASPLASQFRSDLPQRTHVRTVDRGVTALDFHAHDALVSLQNQINFKARAGPVKVKLTFALGRFHPLDQLADDIGFIHLAGRLALEPAEVSQNSEIHPVDLGRLDDGAGDVAMIRLEEHGLV